ncbi:MAG: hypothetical protein PWQ62_560 [Candidatus Methanomethylophilaceae archaeon]|nr:hypothetical protein [Candidatus Methanomethylophilaceae archaeon]
MVRKIVIVGSGAAGMTAASTARKTDPDAKITVITEDEHIAYSPCVIPWVLEGKTSWKNIIMHDPEYYSQERDIEVKTMTKVHSVDLNNKTVDANGDILHYDSLILATGGKVFIPPIPGKDLNGVFVVRTINDGKAIESTMKDADRVAIIGAGAIGLEMALAIHNVGKKVVVVEMMNQVIPRVLDSDMASEVQCYLEKKGIRFVMDAPIQSVNGDDIVESVTAAGKTIPCDMVIFSTGVRANLELPKQMGLDIGTLGGLRVAPSLQPYQKGKLLNNVFACGDLIECESAVAPGPTMSQLGSSAVRQGRVAGINAAGGHALHEGVTSPWVSVMGDIEIAGTGLSTGLAHWYGMNVVTGMSSGFTCARYYPGGKNLKVKVLAERSTGRLIGAQILSGKDATGRINWLSAAILERVTAREFLSRYENAYCPPTSMVRDVVFTAVEDLASKL